MTLEIIVSDALGPVTHGFFTRRGGASSGIFEGLNCGSGSSDQSDIVTINRARVARALGVAAEDLVTVHQRHSAEVVAVEGPFAGAPCPHADAIVTATPAVALGVLTADCQPVLLADERAGVVGAAHAGWKGALGGIIEATVAAMEDLGARRDRIAAVIGPSISQDHYEVGPEFRAEFSSADPESESFFVSGAGDRYRFDLPGYGLHRLRSAGVGHAEWTGHCTYADPERFFSYRRSVHRREPDYGRLISAIRI